MKKILYIHNTPQICGATNRLLEIIDNLDRSFYDPHVIMPYYGEAVKVFLDSGAKVKIIKEITDYPHAEGAYDPIRSFRPWYQISKLLILPLSTIRILRIINKLKCDLIHINSTTILSSIIASGLAKGKCIVHVREVLRKGNFGIRRLFISYIIKICADKIISISKHGAKIIGDHENISIVYDGVDLDYLKPRDLNKRLRDKFSLSNDTFFIGYMGGAIHHKGIITLIKAAKIVVDNFCDVKFLIVGYPPQEEIPSRKFRRKIRILLESIFGIPDYNKKIISFIRYNQLESNIQFLGVSTDIAVEMSCFDILLFPITESHFGNPIIEAGAMEIPVLASNFPSTREIITHNESGLLFEPGNENELAKMIIYSLENKPYLKTLSKNLKQKVLKDFNQLNTTSDIYKIYDNLLF